MLIKKIAEVDQRSKIVNRDANDLRTAVVAWSATKTSGGMPGKGDTGVYFLVHEGEVVYVGMSQKSILRRMGDHATGDYEFDSVEWLRFPASVAPAAKRAFIKSLRPHYNVVRKGDPW